MVQMTFLTLRTRLVPFLLAVVLAMSAAGPALAAGGKGKPTTQDPTTSVDNGNGQGIGWSVEGTHATLQHVADTIDASFLHDDGLTGNGIGIALIDTGVAPVTGLTDVWHGPDLSLDSQAEEARHYDVYGHGTHLAGIITSDRADALGIAPDADLVSLKVGAHDGAVDVTQVIAAIDWVVQHRHEHNIRVLVLAYGTDSTQDPRIDPLSHAVESAWRHGITVVVGAGNTGQASPRLATPATNPYVIAVGAVDTQGTWRVRDDEVPSFVPAGTDGRQPDVYAPGVGIVSAAVPGGYLDTTYPDARQPGDLFRGNGTSQAAAIVGGAVALMLQYDPSLSPDQVKARLIEAASSSHIGPTLNIWDATYFGSANGPQTWLPSTGTGSIDASRGSSTLSVDGVALTGEQDIHGVAFDSAAWAVESSSGTAWNDGVWNDTQWTGWGWNGNTWNGWGWNGEGWHGWGWNGWGWNGDAWNGWGWNGWGWNGWGWNGWGWNGWGWNGVQWD